MTEKNRFSHERETSRENDSFVFFCLFYFIAILSTTANVKMPTTVHVVDPPARPFLLPVSSVSRQQASPLFVIFF